MNIEIAPKKYWINCSYEEDLLYCFQLVIDGKAGWRLPTGIEYSRTEWLTMCWFESKKYFTRQLCIPVRDII